MSTTHRGLSDKPLISSPRQLAEAKRRYWATDARRRFAVRANGRVTKYGRPEDVLDWTALPAGPWACTYCGIPCESWDHQIPLIEGGANQPANLVPSCVPCNQRRTARQMQARIRLITSCRHGHPFSEANTRIGTKGERRCRACARRYALNSYYRKRAAA